MLRNSRPVVHQYPGRKLEIVTGQDPPTTLKVKQGRIPDPLRALAQWVCWRWHRRDSKWSKVPLSPRGGKASVTDPGTWGRFDDALARFEDGAVDGIGFVFTADDPFAGIDLDDCRDPETGHIEDWARAIIDELDSYSEISPTGTGVKIFVKGSVPPGGNRKGALEMYDRDRYFTVTGHRLAGCQDSRILRRGRTLAGLHSRLFGSPTGEGCAQAQTSHVDDDAIIAKARSSQKFWRLWQGDTSGYTSRSEADQSLCNILAHYTSDRAQIARLVRRSGLAREKWERADYRERTIGKALAGKGDSVPTPARTGYTFSARTVAQVAETVRKPEWLVEKLLVRGQLAVLGGPKKSLKTSLAVDLAVSLATATPFLGKFKVYRPVTVCLLSGESGEWALLETVRRVCASRTDMGKPLDPARVNKLLLAFDLPRLAVAPELDALAAGIREAGVEVLIIDPLYLTLLSGSTAQPSNVYEMGPLLHGITRACHDAGATPLFVHHTKKNLPTGGVPGLDDLAFTGVGEFMRQWLLVNHRQAYDPDTGTARLWLASGGSGGQSGGTWALDVSQGTVDENFQGRHWQVKVFNSSELKEVRRLEKDQARRERADEDDHLLLQALARIDPDGGGVTMKVLTSEAGLSRDRAGQALARLLQRGQVEETTVAVLLGQGATRAQRGYKLPPLVHG